MDLYGDFRRTTPKTPTSDSKTKTTQPFVAKTSASLDLFGDLPESNNKDAKLSLFEDIPKKDVKAEKRKSDSIIAQDLKPQVKRQATGLYTLKSYFSERQGERDEMQDAHVIFDNFTDQIPGLHSQVNRLAFYAVYDGHGGARTSKHISQQLHKNLIARFPKGDLSKVYADIKKCFTDVYKKTDEEFLKHASKQWCLLRKPSWKDGSTSTTALIINNTVYVANVGDSKAIVCRWSERDRRHVGLTLTRDHNPSQYDERIRIQKAGGHVREGRVMGILEVSRSLGDGPYKNHGVSCIPDMKRCQLSDNDKFLLIACDGLWKAFTNDAAIEHVIKILSDESIQATETKSADDIRWESACASLASEAVRRLSADNVTVVLVRIGEKTL